ncbi:hypothetical protein [Clostridium sp.]|nr:hypothetical protein [Clostridium sp.]
MIINNNSINNKDFKYTNNNKDFIITNDDTTEYKINTYKEVQK